MHQLTISSDKYPGIQVRVPDLPGVPGKTEPKSGTPGLVMWHRDQSYLVTDETKQALEDAFNQFPDRVSRHLTFTWKGVMPEITSPTTSDAPNTPNTPNTPNGSEQDSPPVVKLTPEDQDLVNIEVGKLLDKTIAQATPILKATAENSDIPDLLRKAYLEAVIAHAEIQKGLQEEAEELMENLFSAA